MNSAWARVCRHTGSSRRTGSARAEWSGSGMRTDAAGRWEKVESDALSDKTARYKMKTPMVKVSAVQHMQLFDFLFYIQYCWVKCTSVAVTLLCALCGIKRFGSGQWASSWALRLALSSGFYCNKHSSMEPSARAVILFLQLQSFFLKKVHYVFVVAL